MGIGSRLGIRKNVPILIGSGLNTQEGGSRSTWEGIHILIGEGVHEWRCGRASTRG